MRVRSDYSLPAQSRTPHLNPLPLLRGEAERRAVFEPAAFYKQHSPMLI